MCYYIQASKYGGLAQLVRASASHAEGRRFESATLHQTKTPPIGRCFLLGKDSRADSKGAGVNGVPVARQSRDPARPPLKGLALRRRRASPPLSTTSSRTSYRSRRRFLFQSQRHLSLTPSLLLSKSKPRGRFVPLRQLRHSAALGFDFI